MKDSGGSDVEEIEVRLDELRTEHRCLDERIDASALNPDFDQLELRRLKKRKLLLKDAITRLESARFPDIIA